ncbi:MAG: Lrp/AsnC family transcriptional regulator [Acidobacteriota bacterium]
MTESATSSELDDFDRAILRLVQQNNQLSHGEIAEQVNLSPSSVRRRLKRLRETGVIEADVSIVQPKGRVAEVVVLVTFGTESVEAVRDFRQRMRDAPEVAQVYSVAGNVDFVLLVQAEDLESYEAWGERNLMADPNIQRYDSHVVWSRVKYSTALHSL